MIVDRGGSGLEEIVQGPAQAGLVEMLGVQHWELRGCLAPFGTGRSLLDRPRGRRVGPKEMLDGLAAEELGMHIQRPGDEPEGIKDHGLDGVPARNEALGSRRNQGVDLLDKADLVDGARHNAQMVKPLDGQRVGVLEHDAGPPERGNVRKAPS